MLCSCVRCVVMIFSQNSGQERRTRQLAVAGDGDGYRYVLPVPPTVQNSASLLYYKHAGGVSTTIRDDDHSGRQDHAFPRLFFFPPRVPRSSCLTDFSCTQCSRWRRDVREKNLCFISRRTVRKGLHDCHFVREGERKKNNKRALFIPR